MSLQVKHIGLAFTIENKQVCQHKGPGNNMQDNIGRHLKLFLFTSNGLSEQDDFSAKLLPLAAEPLLSGEILVCLPV